MGVKKRLVIFIAPELETDRLAIITQGWDDLNNRGKNCFLGLLANQGDTQEGVISAYRTAYEVSENEN
tara:strand:- start:112 stop:315 length:204 start_codon:yes stop_codon:yes gene_type:complete